MRSLLFIPADSEKKLAKGLASGADCLILDLEDSIAPEAKQLAREQAYAFLASALREHQRPRLYVRVNGLNSGLTEDDLSIVMQAPPDGILLPKSVNGASLQHLGALLAVKEAENDIADGATKIMAIVTETPAAIFNMGSYAGASQRLEGLTWGAEDLAAALGAETNRGTDGGYTLPFLLARSLTLFAASSAGVLPIDAVHGNFRDLARLRLECEEAKRDGFAGKMAIHPGQIDIINEVFSPSAESVAKARAIVAAFAAEPHAGVINYEGEMLDVPHLSKARRLLASIGET
ncbi:CoA ester lyase [Methylocapsa sp. D3K7]|uniref:HpcH/HpaI aldolase/citrate lyase family protein n=1 Tax=Methylocapsa sp. D3K7 TaxID=3041435 RepID=UPI00244E9678|nr:CoA ester lyase [Methylocapsa sp. D3K7]WGJ14628.1 CoA ester lyase [Methylocapsa sp. D3K7]